MSNLPLVIARDILSTDIPWMTPIWLATAALLLGATYVWSALKPLRGYFAVMSAIVLASFVIFPFLLQSAAWQSFFAGRAFMTNLRSIAQILPHNTPLVYLILRRAGL